MHLVATAGSLVCSECDHAIPEGSSCISEMPEQLHELNSVGPGVFRHFHARCEECQTGRSCYRVHASRQAATTAQKRTDCTYCGLPISAGEQVLRESFLVLNEETGAEGYEKVGQGLAGLPNAPLKAVRFSDLSPGLRWKFRTAGLGNGRGIRTPAQAEAFFLRSVPASVRSLGERAVWRFLKGKHASHVESVANAPSKARAPGNVVWESWKGNIRRGPRNMTRMQRLSVTASNGAHAAGVVAKSAASSAARGGAFAAALETLVSVPENAIHVRKGTKTKEDAAKDVAKDVSKAGIAGGAVAGGVAVAAAMGAGPLLATAGPVLGGVGFGVFAFSSVRRIQRAIVHGQDDQSLGWVHLRFHAERSDSEVSVSCYDAFASAVDRECNLHEPEDGVPTEAAKHTFLASVWQEDDWYVAQAAGVGVASQGRSVEEALANLREVLELHFEPPVATASPRTHRIEVSKQEPR